MPVQPAASRGITGRHPLFREDNSRNEKPVKAPQAIGKVADEFRLSAGERQLLLAGLLSLWCV